MTCDQARELLLEAEPEDLEGTGASALSRHLGGCPRCAAAAARVLEATRELDAHLGAPPNEGAVEGVLARLADAGTRHQVPVGGRPRPGWRRAAWGSVAMAAAAAGLLLVTRGPAPVQEGTSSLTAAPPPPLVETSSAATVAVLETGNPDITVLWFF